MSSPLIHRSEDRVVLIRGVIFSFASWMAKKKEIEGRAKGAPPAPQCLLRLPSQVIFSTAIESARKPHGWRRRWQGPGTTRTALREGRP